jgi:hypothetical protein
VAQAIDYLPCTKPWVLTSVLKKKKKINVESLLLRRVWSLFPFLPSFLEYVQVYTYNTSDPKWILRINDKNFFSFP